MRRLGNPNSQRRRKPDWYFPINIEQKELNLDRSAAFGFLLASGLVLIILGSSCCEVWALINFRSRSYQGPNKREEELDQKEKGKEEKKKKIYGNYFLFVQHGCIWIRFNNSNSFIFLHQTLYLSHNSFPIKFIFYNNKTKIPIVFVLIFNPNRFLKINKYLFQKKLINIMTIFLNLFDQLPNFVVLLYNNINFLEKSRIIVIPQLLR